MPKKIDDIITVRKSIRDIPVPTRNSTIETKPEPITPQGIRIEPNLGYSSRGRKTYFKKSYLVGVILIILIAILGAVGLRSGATLTYIPKSVPIAFSNDTYTAKQTGADGSLSFSLIKLSKDKSQNVPASGDETVSLKASGTVIIYNTQSISQQLIKTTRLESSDGKIYRIQSDITIPAKGSMEVLAIADEPGASYNINLSDFAIPGFKGGAKYDKVYGRSKAPMTGGFSGTRKKVSDADLAKVRGILESDIKQNLLAQAHPQVPDGFILFDNLANVTYELLPIESADGSSARITLRGNLNAVIFKKSELAKFLADQKLGAQNVSQSVDIVDPSGLNISLLSAGPSASSSQIKINLVGSAVFKAITDENNLAQDLAGKNKAELDSILARYSSIDSAKARISPFWKSVFPNDAAGIKIEEQK